MPRAVETLNLTSHLQGGVEGLFDDGICHNLRDITVPQ